MDAHTHLAETHARLTTSPVVLRYDVVEERLGPDFGYLRVRVDLGDDGFLEMAEYFVIEASSVTVKRYRHHWMDSSQTVLKNDGITHGTILSYGRFPITSTMVASPMLFPGRRWR